MERKTEEQIQWAPRVKPHTIRRLYELDAKGILDENLINEIGFGLLARCESIHRVTHRLCPECGSEMEGAWDNSRYRKISCKRCQWHSTWIAYHRSYKRKRIHGGRAFEFFEAYLKSFPKCKNARQKIKYLIDWSEHKPSACATRKLTRWHSSSPRSEIC